MKKAAILSITLTLALLAEGAFALTAKQIMQKNESLPKAKSSMQTSVLLIIKGSRKEKKEFSGFSKKYGEVTRMRMTFKYPTRLEFLVWSNPGKDNQQWLKLTSGKVRKVASSDKDKPWMNSHFYNSDIGTSNLNDFKYKLLGEADVNGVTCYKILADKIRGTKVYSKRILYVAKNTYLMRKIDLYEKGRHTKSTILDKYKKISGIWTPRKISMIRTDGKGKSILYIKSIKYNVAVSDHKLKREGF